LKAVLRHLAVFLLWNIVAGFFLLFIGPGLGLPLALAISGVYLWGYLLRSPAGLHPARRWAALRLRPLNRQTLRWTIVAVPVMLVFSWSLGEVYTSLVPVPADNLNPFEPILRTMSGRFAIAVFAVAVAPLIEEFVFRGVIQHELERRYGALPGILGAAGFFAAVHLLPWVFPLHFVLGVAFGFVVYATRSIWSAVILHAANNAVAMLGVALDPGDANPTGTAWELGITVDLGLAIGILVLSTIAGITTARKLLEGGRALRLATA
jgi:membrane protease YdiL (CAAX protease family)